MVVFLLFLLKLSAVQPYSLKFCNKLNELSGIELSFKVSLQPMNPKSKYTLFTIYGNCASNWTRAPCCLFLANLICKLCERDTRFTGNKLYGKNDDTLLLRNNRIWNLFFLSWNAGWWVMSGEKKMLCYSFG